MKPLQHSILRMALAAAGVCAALGSAPAAALTSQLSVQWVGVDLVDLDPDDGVTPSISWITEMTFLPLSTASTMAYSYTADGAFVESSRNGSVMDGTQFFPFGPSQSSSAVSLYTLSASSQGVQSGPNGFKLSVQGGGLGYEASGLDMSHPWAYGSAQYQGSISGLVAFTLSANTLATFTITAQGSVVGADAHASASNSLFAQAYTYGTDSAGGQYEVQGSFMRRFNVGNLESRAVNGNLVMSAQTTGYFSAAAPVPEPAGWALLLAGGAVVAGWRRRRNMATA